MAPSVGRAGVGGALDAAGVWSLVMDEVAKRPRLRTLLARLTPRALDGPVLVLAARSGDFAMARDHAADIASIAGRVRGQATRVDVVDAGEGAGAGGGGAAEG
ncbi:MAG: hypothetical protein AAF235_01905, partial [Planctomycetota bacterium]